MISQKFCILLLFSVGYPEILKNLQFLVRFDIVRPTNPLTDTLIEIDKWHTVISYWFYSLLGYSETTRSYKCAPSADQVLRFFALTLQFFRNNKFYMMGARRLLIYF